MNVVYLSRSTPTLLFSISRSQPHTQKYYTKNKRVFAQLIISNHLPLHKMLKVIHLANQCIHLVLINHKRTEKSLCNPSYQFRLISNKHNLNPNNTTIPSSSTQIHPLTLPQILSSIQTKHYLNPYEFAECELDFLYNKGRI